MLSTFPFCRYCVITVGRINTFNSMCHMLIFLVKIKLVNLYGENLPSLHLYKATLSFKNVFLATSTAFDHFPAYVGQSQTNVPTALLRRDFLNVRVYNNEHLYHRIFVLQKVSPPGGYLSSNHSHAVLFTLVKYACCALGPRATDCL